MTPREEVRAVAPRLRFAEGRVLWDGREVRGEPLEGTLARLPPDLARAAGRLYHQAYARHDEGRGAYQHVPDVHLRDAFARAVAAAAPRGVQVTRDRVRGWIHARAQEGPMPEAGSIRLYWSLCAAGAAPFVGLVSGALAAAGVPHRLKVLDDPQAFRRADAGVCYLPAIAWEAAAPVLEAAHAQIAPWLRASTPLFALRLAPGLALAEDPGDGDSFGMHRSRLLALGLWDAREGADPVDAVAARFRAEGCDLDAPHLQPGSTRGYALRLRAREVPT